MSDIISPAEIAEHEWMHGNWNALKVYEYLNGESEEEKQKFINFLECTGMYPVFKKELANRVNG